MLTVYVVRALGIPIDSEDENCDTTDDEGEYLSEVQLSTSVDLLY